MDYPYKRLPLIEEVASLHQVDLSDVHLIACQHLMPSTHLMLRSLFDRGLKPSHVALIGKCYSNCPSVINRMIDDGIDVCHASTYYDYNRPFNEVLIQSLHDFIERQRRTWKPQQKIIILDDGGELLVAANQLLVDFPNKVGIEQTSAGHHRIKQKNINFPIINVARSQTKLSLESPMVAESQKKQIMALLKQQNHKVKNALIIGNGAMGNAIFAALKNEFSLVLSDQDVQRCEVVTGTVCLSDFDLIIGATGSTVVSQQQHAELKPGTILISGSSADSEFDAVHLRRQSKQYSTNCHQDIISNGIILANSGFPINFRGQDEDCVSLSQIQITFALLYHGVCMAAQLMQQPLGQGANLLEIDVATQKIIVKSFFAMSN